MKKFVAVMGERNIYIKRKIGNPLSGLRIFEGPREMTGDYDFQFLFFKNKFSYIYIYIYIFFFSFLCSIFVRKEGNIEALHSYPYVHSIYTIFIFFSIFQIKNNFQIFNHFFSLTVMQYNFPSHLFSNYCHIR